MASRPPGAGELTDLVTIERDEGTARDAYGQRVADWVRLARVRAVVIALVGRELFLARQVRAEMTHEVWFRSSAATAELTSAMRLVVEGRVLAIESCQGVSGWWYVTCREQV